MRIVWVVFCLLLAPWASASGLLDRLSGSDKPAFLSPEQAFAVNIRAVDGQTLQADFQVSHGYYLYRDRITFTAKPRVIQQSKLPEGEMKHDPNFGDIQVYHQPFAATLTLASGDARQVEVEATYQGCSDQGLCYPPVSKTVQVTLPAQTASSLSQPATRVMIAASAATASTIASATPTAIKAGERPSVDSSADNIVALLQQGNIWLVLSFFFGAGFLLAFTPCIFPMIPILSGIIVGQGADMNKKQAFILSLSYVMGMAVTYALAGVAAGLSGDLISNALQTPWALGSFAAIFVILALSMFGFYDLQLPTALQSGLSSTSNRLHGGHLGSVFVMGALSAIIMGPCVAAPLAAALLYIGQSHDAVLGGWALFVMALGMGLPLLLIGTSAGAVLPRAGAWMESVKRFFGVLMLALALYIVQPLLPVSVQMLLWGGLLVVASTYLHVLDVQPHHTTGWHKFQKGVGLLMLLIGIAYLIGALSGARDVFRPLGGLVVAQTLPTSQASFKRIHNMAELEQIVQQSAGKSVMLDFYADWCAACKEMERNTFSDVGVQQRLVNTLLLQIDMTGNTADDKAMLKHFSLFGPPAILFFDAQGQEQSTHRVIGYQAPELFLSSLQQAGI